MQLLDCSMGHYPEYSVALDSAFVVAFVVAFAADSVEVGVEIVVGLAEVGPGIVAEPAEVGPEIVAEPAVAGPDTVAEPGNAAAVLALDTVAVALGIDVAVVSDRDNVAVVEADRIVAAAVPAVVLDIVVAHGRLSVVAVVSVLDTVAAKVSVADDIAGIEAVAGIAVETVRVGQVDVQYQGVVVTFLWQSNSESLPVCVSGKLHILP